MEIRISTWCEVRYLQEKCELAFSFFDVLRGSVSVFELAELRRDGKSEWRVRGGIHLIRWDGMGWDFLRVEDRIGFGGGYCRYGVSC